MNIVDFKSGIQVSMLKDICKQIAEADDAYLEHTAQDLLQAIVGVLEDQSQEDLWTTEGWEHYFGYDD